MLHFIKNSEAVINNCEFFIIEFRNFGFKKKHEICCDYANLKNLIMLKVTNNEILKIENLENLKSL